MRTSVFAAACVIGILSYVPAEALTFTGVSQEPASSSTSLLGGGWHTFGSPGYGTWLTTGATAPYSTAGTLVNNNGESWTPITLTPGTYTYNIYLYANSGEPWWVLNLYFNSAAESTPQISAIVQQSATTTLNHGFFNSPTMADAVTNPDTLSYTSGGVVVTLTDYWAAAPSVYNVDYASAYSFGASGQYKSIVEGFTLTVTDLPVPEPASITVLGAGALALLRRRARL